jgi:isoamylase
MFQTSSGRPLPLGATVVAGGVNFSLFSQNATKVELLLFQDSADPQPAQIIEISAPTLFYWHVQVDGLPDNTAYAYRVYGPGGDAETARSGNRFDGNKVLIDPWARGNVDALWSADAAKDAGDNVATSMRSIVIDAQTYDWEGDTALNTSLDQTVVYELHVRGFTVSPTSGVAHPGTFTGLIEKLPYIRQLGVTAVELMPVFDFDEKTPIRNSPTTGLPLTNFWGYDPIAYFAPQSNYCVAPDAGAHVREFRDFVKAAHRNGLEVILDVVFNHTGEGDQNGPVIDFKGIDNSVFYFLNAPDKRLYRGDLTGCGNAVRCNHPVVTRMIAESLAYWVSEMHVDGFRFDEGAVLMLGEDAQRLEYAPVVWVLNLDERLANTKVIVEPFGGNQGDVLGLFPDIYASTWNYRFKNTIRHFVRGDTGWVGDVATRIAGSSDLFQAGGFSPVSGVSYVTCHDGFTLNDVVSYNQKHNEANGEDSGDSVNISNNYGVEGPTNDPAIDALRKRQIRNFLSILFLSQGVPMLLAGDECRRTQQGNNNPYLQDNLMSWFDWTWVQTNSDLVDFTRWLIDFRKRHPALRRRTFFQGVPSQRGLLDISWHGCKLNSPGFSDPNSRVLAFTIADPADGEDVHAILNMDDTSLEFELPSVTGRHWYRAADTILAPPNTFAAAGNEVAITTETYWASPKSVVVLVSKT